MENNKNKKSVKFQGDRLNFCDFIQVFVFTRNHHLKLYADLHRRRKKGEGAEGGDGMPPIILEGSQQSLALPPPPLILEGSQQSLALPTSPPPNNEPTVPSMSVKQ